MTIYPERSVHDVNVAGSVQPGPQHFSGGQLISEQLLLFALEEGKLSIKGWNNNVRFNFGLIILNLLI